MGFAFCWKSCSFCLAVAYCLQASDENKDKDWRLQRLFAWLSRYCFFVDALP
ncbi:hypothetical protein FOCG_17759 [Fusarium oxysporum f. sp. radicis-lycopersici 26381]|nr:hypothetical protein FOCG_17759 [Fusarium oxysporum f. sp. radicis-lycopersici 26381]